MKISALVASGFQQYHAEVRTNEKISPVAVPGKPGGHGSAINGGELLCLALATCYCNGIYREASKRRIKVEKLEVVVQSNFEKEGESATAISYQVKIKTAAGNEETRELALHTDTVAEIQNTIRNLSFVKLDKVEIL